ncbi:penicillin-insensitive murein endopeptidase [Desulfosoma sp.]|uniref:penicillin-insensitive murein endopeptidase n=1 Tax=Desulfosoma sp. TaxID=2603217 RepID=UPI004049C943
MMNLLGTVATLCTCLTWPSLAHALTLSIGEPYNGRLVNGIPFPTHMGGYTVRNPNLAYATPELIGSVLEAIEAVREKYPNTVDLFIGDISGPFGGPLKGHKSHQNGRDVDLGMYAIGNQPLDCFTPMNARNLDVPKTWTLIEALIRTGRVQYLFVDRKIQKMLFEFALSRGFDEALLNRLFNDVGEKAVGEKAAEAAIRHEPLHDDHIHVRFDAPWSTLAARIDPYDTDKRALIELAQAGFLPKRVIYYVDKRQTDLAALAQSFGVRVDDLVRWNHLSPHAPLPPGTSVVYYRRAFELEPVHLAESLRLRNLIPLEPVQVASVAASLPPVDVSSWVHSEPRKVVTKMHTVRRGDTIYSVARTYGLTTTQLAQMNHINEKKPLRVGSTLIVEGPSRNALTADHAKELSARTNASMPGRASGLDKRDQTNARNHVVQKGDTLSSVARKYKVPLSNLMAWNNLPAKSMLCPGSTLIVSPPGQNSPEASSKKSQAASSQQSSSARRDKTASTLAPQNNTVKKSSPKAQESKSTQPTIHTVAPGETLSAIGRKYNVEVQKILSANKMNNTQKIKPGLRIKIPAQS